jgi:hypothetical protein
MDAVFMPTWAGRIRPAFASFFDQQRSWHMYRFLKLFLVFFWCTSCLAQEPDIENLLGSENESSDELFLLEYLEQLQHSPLDINQASVQEWETLPWIDPGLSQRIVQFRRQHGPFQSLQELTLVEGLPKELVKKLKPYLICRNSGLAQARMFSGRARLLRPLQQSRGFMENKFAGGADKTLIRLQSRLSERFQVGLLTEKDSGERSPFDYQSFYGAVQLHKPELLLLFGSYAVTAGEGLVFCRNSSFTSLSPLWYESKNRDRLLQPNRTTDENSGLFGVAMSIRHSPVQMVLLYHSTTLDASLEENQIRSFPGSGLHRTKNELQDRDTARQRLFGAILRYQPADRFSLSLAGYHSRLAPPVVRQERADNLFSFRGTEHSLMGLSWDLYRTFGNLYGEWAVSDSSWAGTIGLWRDLKKWQWLTTFYYAPASFHNMVHPHLYQPEVNLQQWNIGLGRTVNHSGRFSIMLQIQRHPWLRYHMSYAGTVDWQTLLWLELELAPSLLITCRMKSSLSPISKSVDHDEKQIIDHYQNSFYCQADLAASKTIAWRSRLDWNNRHNRTLTGYSEPDSQGVAMYQQLRLHLPSWCNLCFRATWFQAACYDNRLYLYEPDLPGVMRIKMLYGKGWRRFLLLSLNLLRGMQFSTKYEETIYSDRNSIGSGWDEIRGNRERTLLLQWDCRW